MVTRDWGSSWSISDDEILNYLADQNGAGTAEVSEFARLKQPSAYRRLKRLENDGRVRSRRIGNSLLWEATDSTREGSA